jgi:hypothetical protein
VIAFSSGPNSAANPPAFIAATKFVRSFSSFAICGPWSITIPDGGAARVEPTTYRLGGPACAFQTDPPRPPLTARLLIFMKSADFSIPQRLVGRRSSDFASEPSPKA